MPVRRWRIVRQIVHEVRAVPDHHVVIVYGLTVNPLADVRLVRGTDGMHTVVDLVAVIAQDPDIAAAERRVGARGFDAVVVSRNNVVRLARSGVLDAPLAMARRITRTRDLEARRANGSARKGGVVNSRTTLLPGVRKSKSNRQYAW